MPKKKGKSGKGSEKSGKGSKKKFEIDWSLIPDDIKEIPNPNFSFGTDEFLLENGDTYVGDFCASNIGVVWREGEGVYLTKDNHKYEGIWENDKLLNSPDTKVTYPDGTVYRGSIKNNMYSGSGTYILPNTLPFTCQFKDNTPYGQIVLTDPQYHLWIGDIVDKDDHVVLRPENHFYANLPYERGIGKKVSLKHSEEEIQEAETLPSDRSIMKELKELIFKKSSKTLRDSRETLAPSCHESSSSASETCGCRSDFIPPRELVKAKRSSSVSLLRTFLSKEYRNSCPPVSVIYPTEPELNFGGEG